MDAENVLHVLEDGFVRQRHGIQLSLLPRRLLIKDGVNVFTHIYIVEYH